MKRQILFLALLSLSMLGHAQGGISSEQLQKLSYATYIISKVYVEPVKDSKLVDDALVGMLSKLDPHSVYIPADEVRKMNEPLEGSFDGIGVQFQMMEDTLLVIQTISGGPSEKVGIVAGDRIVAVNDTSIAGVKMQNTDIMKKLRGPKGTEVNVKVVRRGVKNPIDFRIVRDAIPIHSLYASYMVSPTIGYIKLDRFSATTVDEYKDALKQLKSQGMKSLILDLQGNGGGYLKAAVDIVDEFLDNGKMIVYTEGNAQPRQVDIATAKGGFEEGKVVVLVDESSASASEIVSGALQDWDRAVLVGRRTFGKGLVQKPFSLPDDSQMRITIARYYTPTGRCIQKSYEGGLEQYSKDIIERYNHGELMHADSIVFPDSLKYKTLKMRRTVYGGGGIMPDIFIPLDTTKYTSFHRNLMAKGLINKFVLNYMDKNRKSLQRDYPKDKKGSFDTYEKQFNLTEKDYAELIEMGAKDSIKCDDEMKAKSAERIKTQLKALIARDIWSMSEYFQIINKYDDSFLKAVELLNDEQAFAKCLGASK